jgi:hypothetical protein
MRNHFPRYRGGGHVTIIAVEAERLGLKTEANNPCNFRVAAHHPSKSRALRRVRIF